MGIGIIGKEKINLVRDLPLFEKMDESDIEAILEQTDVIQLEKFEKGDILITENKLDRKLFLTIRGSVLVTKDFIVNNVKKSGEIKTLEGRGHFLGEVSAFSGKPRTATVSAITETICIVIDIEKLMNKPSGLGERLKTCLYPRLFELLCKRLLETDDNVVKFKQRNDHLMKEVFRLKQEKVSLKSEYEDLLSQKLKEIRFLEEQIENMEYLVQGPESRKKN